MRRALAWSLIIRRPEFLVAEIPIFAMPILLAGGRGALAGRGVAEGALLFLLLFTHPTPSERLTLAQGAT